MLREFLARTLKEIELCQKFKGKHERENEPETFVQE
jgi:hypothetical protein